MYPVSFLLFHVSCTYILCILHFESCLCPVSCIWYCVVYLVPRKVNLVSFPVLQYSTVSYILFLVPSWVMYPVLCILCPACCILRLVLCMMYPVSCILYSVWCILYLVLCILLLESWFLCTLHHVQYVVSPTLYRVFCILNSILFCNLYLVSCILHSVFCILNSMFCILHPELSDALTLWPLTLDPRRWYLTVDLWPLTSDTWP